MYVYDEVKEGGYCINRSLRRHEIDSGIPVYMVYWYTGIPAISCSLPHMLSVERSEERWPMACGQHVFTKSRFSCGSGGVSVSDLQNIHKIQALSLLIS